MHNIAQLGPLASVASLPGSRPVGSTLDGNRCMDAKGLTIFALLLVAACGTDPGDVALFERTQVEEVVTPGGPYASAADALTKLGYKCETRSGTFAVADRKRSSAPSFLSCSKNSEKGRVECSIHTQVIVVPDGAKVGGVS